MRRVLLTALLAMLVAIPSLAWGTCESFDTVSSGSAPPNGYEPVGHCNWNYGLTGVPCPDVDLIFRNATDFATIWADLHDNESNPPPVPSVDFSTKEVVAITLGQRSNSGYGVQLGCLSYITVGGHLRAQVLVTELKAGPNCIVFPMIIKPYLIVAISKMGESWVPVDFTHQEQIYDCP